MRQVELAKQLGISKSYLSMIYSGQRPCSPELADKLSSLNFVNNKANLSFARRKSGVRVSSAPQFDLAIEELSVRELLEVLLDDSSWHYVDVPDYIPCAIVQSISWLRSAS